MAIAESRPYRTPSPSSVAATLSVLSPTPDVENLSDAWTPGEDVVIRGSATLGDDFWAETMISPEEDVWLVGVAACAPARSRWRAQSRFQESDGIWAAEIELTAHGGELAVELTADLWVVGPGRTGSPSAAHAVHRSAKLWQLSSPISIRLESEASDFPTSASSFSATGRRAVPWIVEITPDAEPNWSISSSLRLFVNTDLEICHQIVEGTADEALYIQIQSDIHLAVLHQLGGWRDSIRIDRMLAVADDDLGSLAALGSSIAASLGLTLDEGCRLAHQDPIGLLSRSREALDLYRPGSTA